MLLTTTTKLAEMSVKKYAHGGYEAAMAKQLKLSCI